MFQVPRKEKSLLVRLWQIILESKDITSSWLPRNSELQWPMAKQLGALPRVLQDRHDTLRMTMQVNNADGTNDNGQHVETYRAATSWKVFETSDNFDPLGLRRRKIIVSCLCLRKKHVPHLSSHFAIARAKDKTPTWLLGPSSTSVK